MSSGAEIAAGLASGLFNGATNLWNTWHNMQTSQRDFDYQVALQNIMFQREDNAVQRRMADLKAAGLNPNLAAGSAAGAGSVVGRSNTPQINMSGNPIGTALDTYQAVQQLRAQREQNQILKNQRIESEEKARMTENERVLSDANLYQLLGMPMDLEYSKGRFSIKPRMDYKFDKDGRLNWNVFTEIGKGGRSGQIREFNGSPLQQIFNYQLQNDKNSADMLQRDLDFYTADKIAEYFGAGISAFSGIGSGYRAFKGRR